MQKIEAHFSLYQFYKDWHADARSTLLSWAIVGVLSGLMLNATSLLNDTENLANSLTASPLFALVQYEKADVPSFATEETDRIIIKYKNTAPGLSIAQEQANIEKAQGLTKILTIRGIDAVVYQVSALDTAHEAVDRIKANHSKALEYAEVDLKAFPAYTPDDPYMNNSVSWHHVKIGSRAAWDITKGDGVTIAILDGGTNCNHADLAPNCVPGWNTYANSSDTSDVNGHGTLVAGNAASKGDNALGGAGIAYNSKIMPIRISATDGSSSCSSIASGITYAADHGAKVASNSYWVHGCTVTNDAAKYLESKGGIYVRAANNTGASEDPYVPPANEIVHVSATNQSDVRTSWSSYGQFVDISAPGIDVYCTTSSGGYGNCWGTSFSVPTVSGVFALMFSVNPNLSATQAKNILFTTTDDLGEPGWDQYYGHGRVNAAKAVAAAQAAIGTRDTVPPSIPQNLRSTSITSNSISLAWSASTDDNSGVKGYSVYRDDAKLTTVSGTSYTNSGLTPLTTYTYTVRAEDTDGNVSSNSNTLSASTADVTFGISMYSVSKTSTSATVNITLTKPGTVTVKYGTTSTSLNLSTQSSATVTTHAVPLINLSANTVYYYQIVATDGVTTTSSSVSSFKTSKQTGAERGGGKPR